MQDGSKHSCEQLDFKFNVFFGFLLEPSIGIKLQQLDFSINQEMLGLLNWLQNQTDVSKSITVFHESESLGF